MEELTIWDKVVQLENKDDMNKGVANTLNDYDIKTILAVAEFFGAEKGDLQQVYFDLKMARYRVFDWLAMGVQGRINNKSAVKVFAHSFIKTNGVTSKFIEDLRITDYDIDRTWEDLKLNI